MISSIFVPLKEEIRLSECLRVYNGLKCISDKIVKFCIRIQFSTKLYPSGKTVINQNYQLF